MFRHIGIYPVHTNKCQKKQTSYYQKIQIYLTVYIGVSKQHYRKSGKDVLYSYTYTYLCMYILTMCKNLNKTSSLTRIVRMTSKLYT